ncbi:MAG: hypothetical protein L7T26_07835 [Pseudomonadales bacterium]|nr:hypothetical protein [Pseudomonadales bacterium]
MLQREDKIQRVLGLWALVFSLFLSMGVQASDHDEAVMWVLGSYSSKESAEGVAREIASLTGQQTGLQEIQRSGLTLFRVVMPLGTEREQSRLSSLLLSAEFDQPWRTPVKQSTLITPLPQSILETNPSDDARLDPSAGALANSLEEADSGRADRSQAMAPVTQKSSPPVETKSKVAVSDRLSLDSDYHPIRLYPRN